MTPTILYYQPHQQRKSEALFFEALRHYHPDAIHSSTHFLVPSEKMDQCLDVNKMIDWLAADRFLPPAKRTQCLQILGSFPANQLRIAFRSTEISFDFVLQKNGQTHYWEFQESQHTKLTVDRPKKVYTPAGEPVIIPRFFQRLMRDLWRISFFRPYTSVWKDWFEGPTRTDECLQLGEGYRDYHLPGKFSFKSYLDYL